MFCHHKMCNVVDKLIYNRLVSMDALMHDKFEDIQII